MKKRLKTVLFLTLFAVLAYNILEMPRGGDINSPAYNEATEHFIEKSESETGAINIIGAILTDYRAFDTLGETIVLFTSIVAVVSVLRPDAKPESEVKKRKEETEDA